MSSAILSTIAAHLLVCGWALQASADNVVTVAATDAAAGEPGTGQGSGTFTFTRTGAIELPLMVNFTVSGTAMSGTDYAVLGSGITFAPGATSTNVTVSVINDNLKELDETVVMTLASGADYTVGSPLSATVTIEDDDQLGWIYDLPMVTARVGHTATLLPDGRVLVAGGGYNQGYFSSAELRDPITGAWTVITPMAENRYQHTATLLPDGRVLVAGGLTSVGINNHANTGAELFDPKAGTWTVTGAMATRRYGHTATLLPNGKVLVTGGGLANGTTPSAELYDPSTRTWIAAAAMSVPRFGHNATLLPNGTVMIAGGSGLASAEVYDPANGTWAATGSMAAARGGTATLLLDGAVLVVGAGAETYDPATGQWRVVGPMATGWSGHTATLLPSGNVLVAGGTLGSTWTNSVEQYQPSTGTWVTAPAMNSARSQHTATLLPDGRLLVIGGQNRFGNSVIPVSSTELFVETAVAIVATDTTAGETETGQGSGTFTVTRIGTTNSLLTVNFMVSGTATRGADYTALETNVTFTPGVMSTNLTVGVLDDNLVEGDETVVLTLASGTGYAIGSPALAAVTIWDDEAVVGVAVTDETAGESGTGRGSGTISVTRMGATNLALTVNFTLGGTATSGTDYTALGTGVTFAPGATSTNLTVNVLDDTLVEGDETVVLTLAAGGGYVVGNASMAMLAILDDEPLNCALAGASIVGWWSGDFGGLDQTGVNHGYLSNGATIVAAKVGSGFLFNGNDQYVHIPDSPALNFTNQITIEAWVNPTAWPPALAAILSKDDASGVRPWALALDGISHFPYGQLHLSSGLKILNGWTVAKLNEWQHVALTYDGTTITLYVNGALNAIQPATGTIRISPAPIRIGARAGSPSYPFTGMVDEPTVYSRALTPAEIQTIYNAGMNGKCKGGVPPSAPIILAQSQSQTLLAGTNAVFSVIALGTSPLAYQWRRDGANLADGGRLSGATSSQLSVSSVLPSDAGAYSVVVSNSVGSVSSSNAFLTVNLPVVITSQPSSFMASAGTNAVFGVGASATPPLFYQWRRAGTNLVNGARISGVSTSLLIISNTQPSDAGLYSVVVSNSVNSVTSSNATLTVILPAAISSQPSSRTVAAGASTTFSVSATGSPPLSYQWRFAGTNLINGGRISGATSSQLTINSVQQLDGGAYSVVVSNPAGSVASIGATLTVTLPVVIVSQPVSTTVLTSNTAVFNVAASGTFPLFYQWRRSGTNLVNGGRISGATGSQLTISNVQLSDAGAYSVVVSNSVSSVISSNATLSVTMPPAVLMAVSTTKPAGGPIVVIIRLLANGNENALGFTLEFGGQPTSSLLTFDSVVPGFSAQGVQLVVNTNELASGRLGIALALPAGVTFGQGNRELAMVQFRSSALTGTVSQSIPVAFGDVPTVRQLSSGTAAALPMTSIGGTITLMPSPLEADTAPRPDGDRIVGITDWVQVGRFAALLDVPNTSGEFQQADCAPRDTLGDGQIKITDWVQAGRYAAGLDSLTVAGGPTNAVRPEVNVAGGSAHAASAGRELRLMSTFAAPGQLMEVPVMLESQGDENALSFSVSFHPAAFSFAGLILGTNGSTLSTTINTSHLTDGRLGVILGLPAGSTFNAGQRELIKVSLTALANAKPGGYPLTLADQPVLRSISSQWATELSAEYAPATLIVALPALRIDKRGSGLTLSWSEKMNDYSLQTLSGGELPNGTWTNVNAVLQTNGEAVSVTVPLGAQPGYFRLFKP
jgi:predicted RecA/RadA family phage recombinase